MNASMQAQLNTDPDTRRMAGKNYVLALLGRLIQHRLLVTLQIPGSESRHTSTVLALDGPDNSLLLDQIFPARERDILQAVGHLSLSAKVEGAIIRCELALRGIEQVDGLSYYRMALPESIEYLQRRQGHRVQVDRLGVMAEIYTAEGMACKGILYDISALGLSIAIKEDQVFRNTETYRCTIYPPHESPFFVRIEICCRRHDAARDVRILGGSFIDLDKRDEHALSKLVGVLERQLLRSRREPAVHPARHRPDKRDEA